jgi:hypothetical protein
MKTKNTEIEFETRCEVGGHEGEHRGFGPCGAEAEFFVNCGESPATGRPLWLAACAHVADEQRPINPGGVIAYDAIRWAPELDPREVLA